ncbi:hypothetical protein [Nubsella zeaxanthinifaciens]|uniref:hypothetical protein n=1 Tax=Nubsella zeaxanthinifaciens TaxID=392412 RepID=UPI000DE42A2E|nr:hypothetical protein [Nubsella zeaxanthinifaciens]
MMLKNILIGIVVPLSILLPIGVFIFKYKYADRAMKTIFYYLIAAGITNLTAILLIEMGMRNLPLLHVYTVVETLFFLSYFKSIFNSQKISRYLNLLMVVFPIICIINFLFLQDIFSFNTYTRPLEALIITAICLFYLYRSGFVEDLMKKPVSWVNIGIMAYFPAASIIFLMSNYFVFKSYNKELNTLVWNIHSLLVLIMYLAFTKAFTLIPKTKKVNGAAK